MTDKFTALETATNKDNLYVTDISTTMNVIGYGYFLCIRYEKMVWITPSEEMPTTSNLVLFSLHTFSRRRRHRSRGGRSRKRRRESKRRRKRKEKKQQQKMK